MKGINSGYVMGNNDTSQTSQDSIDTNADQPPSQSTQPTEMSDQSTDKMQSTSTSKPLLVVDKMSVYHNKRHPKSKGKHLRPTLPIAEESAPIQQKAPKSEFVTVMHSLKITKKVRKFHCTICNLVTDSQAKANKHYRSNHPPVKCHSCCLTFNNPNSLRRHSYTHLPMKYPCRSCDRVFPFKSDLVNHRLKHRQNPGFICNHELKGGICGKWFYAKSDLTKHMKIHDGVVYSCYECNYTTLDIRYLRAHCYTYSDRECYKCEICNKPFKHHTQLKLHKENCK